MAPCKNKQMQSRLWLWYYLAKYSVKSRDTSTIYAGIF